MAQSMFVVHKEYLNFDLKITFYRIGNLHANECHAILNTIFIIQKL
jgi:hypothetical protein